MTRTAKAAKLAHAVREYRGSKNPGTGKWRVPPKPSAKPRVERWLAELKLDVAESMAKIDAFETFDQFRAWLRKIQFVRQD